MFVCSAIADNGATAKIDTKEIEIISSRDLVITVAPYLANLKRLPSFQPLRHCNGMATKQKGAPLMPSPRYFNPKIEDERKAAKNAKAILGALTPSSPRTDRIIFVLRYAANSAATCLDPRP